MYKRIFIIADIEGSTGCPNYEASSFNTSLWYDACIEMSLDVNAVVSRLFDSGAEEIYVKDFHRTGYNLLPELIDKRAVVIHGYKEGPVPGIGDLYGAEAVMFIGMHASSGSGGFLAHTLTSRYSRIIVNGRRVSELQLFASSMYRYSIKPVFFSGCETACMEAEEDIPGIKVFHVLKSEGGFIDKEKCRELLAEAAEYSSGNAAVSPYLMKPPFTARLDMRDGNSSAEKTARRWNLKFSDNSIFFTTPDFDGFYNMLIKITYFSPFTSRIAAAGLMLFNLYGRAGLAIVRYRRRSQINNIVKKRQKSSG